MARPISFNKDTIIEKSMLIFWKNGFQGTSMRDIGRETGLNPGSLYGSFGNKRNLFLLVLEHYYGQLTKSINQSLNDKQTNDRILRDFFQLLVIQNERDDVKGCLLVNSLLELANDGEMQAYIAAMFTGFEEMFYWVVVSGKKTGEFKSTLDARDMAQYLVNNYFGLRVQCMTEQGGEQLSSIIESFLSRLE